jgi:hypothetical protein
MPPASLPIPAKRALPSKEATLFKELLTLYETRQLKKGLKTADLILKKFPEHGGRLFVDNLPRQISDWKVFYRDLMHEGSAAHSHGKA